MGKRCQNNLETTFHIFQHGSIRSKREWQRTKKGGRTQFQLDSPNLCPLLVDVFLASVFGYLFIVVCVQSTKCLSVCLYACPCTSTRSHVVLYVTRLCSQTKFEQTDRQTHEVKPARFQHAPSNVCQS